MVINEWYQEKLAKLSDSNKNESLDMLNKLEPFIEWLEESDEDSDDDE